MYSPFSDNHILTSLWLSKRINLDAKIKADPAIIIPAANPCGADKSPFRDIDNGSIDRISNQHAKPAAPNDMPILVPANQEAIEDTKYHDALHGTNADPTKPDKSGHEQVWKKRIVRPQPMSYEGRKHPTRERTGIDDGERIESEVWRSIDDPLRIDRNMEYGAYSPERKKKRLRVNKDYEGDDTSGPAEAEHWLQAPEDDGIEDSACVSRKNLLKIPPAEVNPTANALFVLKYVDTMAALGTYKHPIPNPTHNPCARKISQYLNARLVIINPKTAVVVPTIMRVQMQPLS
ncbi:MAG: hypothetical protein Q9204_005828 [Flavoplaca sp. TL-2023a]